MLGLYQRFNHEKLFQAIFVTDKVSIYIVYFYSKQSNAVKFYFFVPWHKYACIKSIVCG